jgi:hypothetical protein
MVWLWSPALQQETWSKVLKEPSPGQTLKPDRAIFAEQGNLYGVASFSGRNDP